MTMRHRLRSGSARRGFATITSAALLLSMMAVPATATHFDNTDVLDADNAVEAGVNWSEFTFDSASDVALGRNDKFPDNLASSVIQGDDTPLLYTDGDSLSEETAAELDRLGAETIHVLGGEEAISEDVVDELEALGYETHRDAGETRIETALDIAATHAANATHGLVVRAFGDAGGDETRAWADALAAGGWAAEEGWPVFLTQTEELNDNVAAYLEDSAIESVTIIGGTSAVSAAVASDLEALGIEVDRVFGPNRFATAVEIAEARGFADAGDADTVILAEGQQSDAWAGGFAAAAFSAISGAPIVLSNGENIPPETEAFLEGANGDGTVALVCGPFVEPEACDEAATILGQEHAPHTNQAFTVTPDDAATINVGADRSFTVSNLDNVTTVDIALVPCDEVTRDNSGVITFGDNEGDANEADDLGSSTVAHIDRVNGVIVNTDYFDDANVVNGQVTFRIMGDAAGCVVAVVFDDADDQNDLDLGANDQPTEDFVVTGEIRVVAVSAVNATPESAVNRFATSHTVTAQLEDANAGAVAVAGRNVRFQVYRGTVTCDTAGDTTPATGTVVTTGSGTTDADGKATFSYTGPADPNAGAGDNVNDCIFVFYDANNNGTFEAGDDADVVSKRWTDETATVSALDLQPERDTNPVGTNHTVTATLTNQFGEPAPANTVITFEVFRESATTPVIATTQTTNAQGQATLTYSGPSTQADDTIVACVEGNDAGTTCDVAVPGGPTGDATPDIPNDTAVKRWVSTPTTVQSTGDDSCVLFADTANDFVDVEDSANADRNLRLPYDANDRFDRVNPNTGAIEAIDLTTFESEIGRNDRIQVDFVPGGVSTFTLANDTNCALNGGEGSTSGTTDIVAPQFQLATADASTETVAVEYTEVLDCTTVQTSDYTVVVAGTPDTTFTVGCTGDTVTFGTVESAPGETVTVNASTTNTVEDMAGNDQPNSDTISDVAA